MSVSAESTKPTLADFRSVGDHHFADLLHAIDKHELKVLWQLRNDEELFGRSYSRELVQLIDQVRHIPSWIDEKSLEHSADFFQKNAFDLSAMLGLASLPYCYGGADGAVVLIKTGRILDRTKTRILETGRFVVDVCAPEAFTGKGKGFLSCLKVRIIHQFVRDQMLRTGWDVEDLGYPVNQLDQASTNLSFSLIAIRALRKTGKEISDADAQAYLQRWNAISSLLGLQDDLLRQTMRTASHLARSIERVQFRASAAGAELTQALVKSLIEMGELSGYPKRILDQYMAYLLGDQVAGYIGLQSGRVANLFEFSALLTQMREVFKWIPSADFGPVGDRKVDPEAYDQMLVNIPMLT